MKNTNILLRIEGTAIEETVIDFLYIYEASIEYHLFMPHIIHIEELIQLTKSQVKDYIHRLEEQKINVSTVQHMPEDKAPF